MTGKREWTYSKERFRSARPQEALDLGQETGKREQRSAVGQDLRRLLNLRQVVNLQIRQKRIR